MGLCKGVDLFVLRTRGKVAGEQSISIRSTDVLRGYSCFCARSLLMRAETTPWCAAQILASLSRAVGVEPARHSPLRCWALVSPDPKSLDFSEYRSSIHSKSHYSLSSNELVFTFDAHRQFDKANDFKFVKRVRLPKCHLHACYESTGLVSRRALGFRKGHVEFCPICRTGTKRPVNGSRLTKCEQ